MKLRHRHREFQTLTISALDLFASALGVFILMTFLLYPYYQHLPALKIREAEKKTDLETSNVKWGQALQSQMTLDQTYQDVRRSLLSIYEEKRLAHEELDAARAADQAAIDALAQARIEMTRVVPPVQKREIRFGDLDIDDLDLVFVIDTTSSMKRIIDGLRADLAGIINVLHRLAPSLRLGIVAYKDNDPESSYLTRVLPLRLMNRANLSIAEAFVADLKAMGGGDIPERIDAGLERAFAMNWRKDTESWIVVIGDARIHPQRHRKLFSSLHRFRQMGDRRKISAIFVHHMEDRIGQLTDSGRKSVMASRQFFSDLAQAGGGAFVAHRYSVMESVLSSIFDE